MGIADWRARGKRSRIYLTTETESFYKGALLWIVTSKLTSVTADWRARGKSEQDIHGGGKVICCDHCCWAATFLGGSGSGSPRSRCRHRPNWVGSCSIYLRPIYLFLPGCKTVTICLYDSLCRCQTCHCLSICQSFSFPVFPSFSSFFFSFFLIPFFFLLFPFFLFSKKQWLLGVELEQDRKKVRYISVHYWRGRR